MAVEKRELRRLMVGDDAAWKQYVLGELRLAYRRASLHRQAISQALDMIEKGVEPELALEAMRDALDYVIPRSEG